MSSTLPADEHKSEAKIPSTPTVKLADFLKKESVIDGSPLELDSNPPTESGLDLLARLVFDRKTSVANRLKRSAAGKHDADDV